MLRKSIAAALFISSLVLSNAIAQTEGSASATFLSKINVVDVAKPDTAWSPASVGQRLYTRDRLRTGEDSRASARLSDASVLRVDELATIEILPPRQAGGKSTFDVKQGALYFFSRGTTHDMGFATPAANGAIRGTEFLLSVAATGKTTVTMLDGRFELSNSAGTTTLGRGQLSHTEPGSRSVPEEYPIAVNCEETDSAPWHLLIEMKLPFGRIVTKATQSELLAAIGETVKRWREFSPEIVKSAIHTHPTWATEIVRQAIVSLGRPHDCKLIGGIVGGAIAAAPDQAAQISEIGLTLAPECRDILGNLPPPGSNCENGGGGGGGDENSPPDASTNNNPPPGSSGGGSGQNLCIVCHNGHDIRIPCDQVAKFLRNHPGDRAGSCRPTPVTNQ
ncbi:MAG: FecR family protein [Verrucomicrobiota bacterium]